MKAELIQDYGPQNKMNMRTLFLTSIMITISFATLSTVRARGNQINATAVDVNRAVSGPYRDGLYLGSLAANHGQAFHISAGRWAKEKDRVAFSEGYRSAFSAVIARNSQNEAK